MNLTFVFIVGEDSRSKCWEKTKYLVMSRDQNAGRRQSIKIDNSSLESVEHFRYLGTSLTDKSSVQEEI